MKKESEKHNENYPVELPSRGNKTEHSPIMDVLDEESFPTRFGNRHSGVHYDSFNSNLSEVVATEITPQQEEQTIPEQYK